nr:peroxidase 12-like [Coffea arabica]
MALTTTALLCLVFSSYLLHSSIYVTKALSQSYPPLAEGLSWDFYDSSCPKLESTIRRHLRKAFKGDIGLAPALLRIHFHDCFVQGCDASVLLAGSASGPSEQDAPPNLTLRREAIQLIDELRMHVHRKCGTVVSCADITALAARDSVYLSGGPEYAVPLGRRDGQHFATRNETLAFLPPPTGNTTSLIASFGKLNLDTLDLVALSGGHTIGIGHCGSFSNRLYPTRDPVMENSFARKLYRTCPTSDSNNTVVLDLKSPSRFDNKYCVNLMNRQGLFTSDQDLYTDRRTRGIVTSFALDQELFFESFAYSMVKMGQLSVLTGNQGEIRANCSARNLDLSLSSVVEDGGKGLSQF